MKKTKQQVVLNSLRRHRKARGLKQRDVAGILGLKSASMISRWESSLCLPKPANMFKLAVLYRTMVDGLFIDLRRLLQKEILKAEQKLLENKTRDRNAS